MGLGWCVSKDRDGQTAGRCPSRSAAVGSGPLLVLTLFLPPLRSSACPRAVGETDVPFGVVLISLRFLANLFRIEGTRKAALKHAVRRVHAVAVAVATGLALGSFRVDGVRIPVV